MVYLCGVMIYQFIILQLMISIGDDRLGTAVQQPLDGILVLAQFGGTEHMDTQASIICVCQLLQERQNGRHIHSRATQ